MNVVEKTAADELAEAQAEHHDLIAEWRRIEDDAKLLARQGVLVTGGGGTRLDAQERALADVELGERRRVLAPALRAAKGRLDVARVCATNERLSTMLPSYVAVSEAVDAARERVERTLAEHIAALIELSEAADDEAVCVRGLIREATVGAPDEQARASIVLAASDQGTVPVHVGVDGRPNEVRQRPQTGLFGGRIDPRGARLWENVHAVARGGRRRLTVAFENDELVRAVERALS